MEDSQIDFAAGNFVCTFRGVGVLHRNVSIIWAAINFSNGEIARKALALTMTFLTANWHHLHKL